MLCVLFCVVCLRWSCFFSPCLSFLPGLWERWWGLLGCSIISRCTLILNNISVKGTVFTVSELHLQLWKHMEDIVMLGPFMIHSFIYLFMMFFEVTIQDILFWTPIVVSLKDMSLRGFLKEKLLKLFSTHKDLKEGDKYCLQATNRSGIEVIGLW